MYNPTVFCYLLLFLCVNVHGRRRKREVGVHPETSTHFDVLIFTQRWPQTVCFAWKEHAPSHTCNIPEKTDEWTIHGIWPSLYHQLGPQYCNSSLPFNETALKPLEYDLKRKWLDIEVSKDPYSFWKHEWNKHGTCAAILEQLNTEFKYFQEGLSLLDMYDMKHVLRAVNILPGSVYTVKSVLHGIEKVLGKRAEVMCVNNSNKNESYIFEIRICFDKQLQLINCDGVYMYPTDCDLSGSVTYPGNVPQEYRVIQV